MIRTYFYTAPNKSVVPRWRHWTGWHRKFTAFIYIRYRGYDMSLLALADWLELLHWIMIRLRNHTYIHVIVLGNLRNDETTTTTFNYQTFSSKHRQCWKFDRLTASNIAFTVVSHVWSIYIVSFEYSASRKRMFHRLARTANKARNTRHKPYKKHYGFSFLDVNHC